ncbi:hypothetical protein ACWGLF_20015 [Streptomyces puniciscabiei]
MTRRPPSDPPLRNTGHHDRPPKRRRHPRSYREPVLGEYRERLLTALGVTEDHR